MMPICPRQLLRRCGELTYGLLVWNVTDYAFDYALYPFVVWKLGPVLGGGIMTLLSLAVCLVLLRIYDRLQRDWLGIEFVKELRHYDGKSRWQRRLAWLLSWSDGVAFVILSAKYDPFITTAYMRHGKFNGMTRRDWKIFIGSGLLANLIWIAVCAGGIKVVRAVLGW